MGEVVNTTADFKRIARDVLKGKWKIAVLVGLVATILGFIEEVRPKIKLYISNTNVRLELGGQTIFSIGDRIDSGISTFLGGNFTFILITSLIFVLFSYILGSCIMVGYAKFNLNLVDRLEVAWGNLFSYFSYWKTTALTKFLKMIYILLWSLLFVIPGIIAIFNYAMTEYILAENPEMSANEVINRSKQMMKGNRMRLFWLEISFIGWSILCILTFGIGFLWLNPYKYAAETIFYREISGTD